VPQLFDFISRQELTFRRWYSQAPYLPQCGAFVATPHARRLLALPAQEQYAAMQLWRGTLATHSVVVSRKHAVRGSWPPAFADGASWLRYVPIRLPETLCIQERLPAGAAGVLLSRFHSSPDLILPVDAREKQMLDEVDGRRSIAATAEAAGGDESSARTRHLFERLFWYDQVVFDASRS
jgi:hypothetical protein